MLRLGGCNIRKVENDCYKGRGLLAARSLGGFQVVGLQSNVLATHQTHTWTSLSLPPPPLQLLDSISQGSQFYSYSPDCHCNVGHRWGISSLPFQTEMELNGFCLFSAVQCQRVFLMACEAGEGPARSTFWAHVLCHLIDVCALSLLPRLLR